MKNKFITTVVATALALTMTFSLANGMDVKAAEITEDSLVAAEDTNVGNESVDIQQQEPVEISELETTENNDLSKSSESITVDESIAEDILATQADTAVVVGTVSDYLTAKGDAKLYNINLPAGVYLQAQLTTPANADLDYDLYLLDAEGKSDEYIEKNVKNQKVDSTFSDLKTESKSAFIESLKAFQAQNPNFLSNIVNKELSRKYWAYGIIA